MSNREAGKGDSLRPVDLRTFESNWDKIKWNAVDQKSNSKYDKKAINNSNRINARRSQ